MTRALRHIFNLVILTPAGITISWAMWAAMAAISLDPRGVGAVSTISAFVTKFVIVLATITHVLLRRASRRGVVRRRIKLVQVGLALMIAAVVGTDWWISHAAMTEPDFSKSIEAVNAEIERLHGVYWTAIKANSVASTTALAAQFVFWLFSVWAAVQPQRVSGIRRPDPS